MGHAFPMLLRIRKHQVIRSSTYSLTCGEVKSVNNWPKLLFCDILVDVYAMHVSCIPSSMPI